jgi:hypothetical protein
MSRLRRALATAALALGSLALAAALLELLASRAESELPEWLGRSNPVTDTGIELPDPDLFWRYRANQSLVKSYHGDPSLEGRSIHVRTNGFGLRDRSRTREKPPGVFRILSLGESTTFGDRVEAAQTYSSRLEALLNAEPGRRVEVWNCGICSYTTYQSVRWLELDGLAFDPDLVLFFHEINDFLPTFHRTGDGQALGLGRTDLELGAARRRVGPLIRVLERSHFYRWLRIRVLLAASRALAPSLAPTASAPAPEASPYDVALQRHFPWKQLPAGPEPGGEWPAELPYLENENPLCRVPDPDRVALLSRLVELLRARGVDLVLIHPAYRPSRPHRCVLTELAKREHVPVVEMERILHDTGLPKSATFLDTFHPTAFVHLRLAEEIARVVRPRIPSTATPARPASGRKPARSEP